jgi:AraC-like DNA-binding protein
MSITNKNIFISISLATVILIAGNFVLYRPAVDVVDGLQNLLVTTYSDASNGGNSFVSYVPNDNTIKWTYRREKGIPFPYMGVFIEKKDHSFFSAEDCDVRLIARTSGSSSTLLRFEIFGENFTDPNIQKSFVYKQRMVTGANNFIDEMIDLNTMEVPSYWTVDRGITTEQMPKYSFAKIGHIVFDHDPTTPYSKAATFELISLQFVPKKTTLIVFNATMVVLTSILVFFIYRKSEKKKLVVVAPLQRTALESNPSDPKDVLVVNYLAANYVNSSLSVNDVADALKLNAREVSNIIKGKYNLSFKQYLNFLRMEEAKHLLKTTNMQVKEISIVVGYENLQHFLRVFKLTQGQTPSEFKNG